MIFKKLLRSLKKNNLSKFFVERASNAGALFLLRPCQRVTKFVCLGPILGNLGCFVTLKGEGNKYGI